MSRGPRDRHGPGVTRFVAVRYPPGLRVRENDLWGQDIPGPHVIRDRLCPVGELTVLLRRTESGQENESVLTETTALVAWTRITFHTTRAPLRQSTLPLTGGARITGRPAE